MEYTIREEIYFEKPHQIISTIYEAKTYQYLVLGNGLIPLHKNKTINDRDLVMSLKKIVFGKEVMRQRMKELLSPSTQRNK